VQPIRWTSLKAGLLVLVVLIVLPIVAVVGPTIGHRTMRLYVATDDATGVIRGAEVWHSGERIGEVEGTSLRPVRVDTSQRVLVRLATR